MRVANFPMGAMAELMSAVVFSGICDRHPGVRFVLEEAGVGWVPFLFWRFDREYDFGGPATRVFKPDVVLSDKPSEFVRRQVFFTFEVEEEGGFRRVPEIGLRNFLWASDFPGLDSPWPDSKAMGHAPGRGGTREGGARPVGLRQRRQPLQDSGHIGGSANERIRRSSPLQVWPRSRQEMARQILRIKRVYQPPDTEDGVRVLVDRLWPRGLSREKAEIDLWLKEIAPQRCSAPPLPQ